MRTTSLLREIVAAGLMMGMLLFCPIYTVQAQSWLDDDEEEAREGGSQELESLRSRTSDLEYEMGRLRRNADSYDADDYSRKLRRLQGESEDLSSEAAGLGATGAASDLDDSGNSMRKLRRDIESDESYFYKERSDEVPSRTRKIENLLGDAENDFGDSLH